MLSLKRKQWFVDGLICAVFAVRKMDFGAFCIAGAWTYQCYKIWMCSISVAIFKFICILNTIYINKLELEAFEFFP